LYIDAIGLEMFLMLFEVQVLVIIGALLNKKSNQPDQAWNI
jgi:hypothetical protein